jgi:hypothetical protein
MFVKNDQIGGQEYSSWKVRLSPASS